MDNASQTVGVSTLVLTFVIGIITLMMWGCPQYNVWTSEMNGKADLVEAQQNRKIIIEEAQANLIKDSLEAEGEVFRATGVARAIEIENGKLSDQYIKYLFIKNMDGTERIYIPTEASMPILEAKNTK